MDNKTSFPLASQVDDEMLAHLRAGGRIMCVGPSGVGKSTWIKRIAMAFDGPLHVLSADPGRPIMGPPGAVVLMKTESRILNVEAIEGLASMDCARYRTPLCTGAMKLVRRTRLETPMLLDAPGMTRGEGAKELLVGLAQIMDATKVLAFIGKKGEEPYLNALALQGFDVVRCRPDEGARRLSDAVRQSSRDEAWQHFMRNADQLVLPCGEISWRGVVPRSSDLWAGRQVVLCGPRGQSLGMGWITHCDGTHLKVEYNAWEDVSSCRILCMRDAGLVKGRLKTIQKPKQKRLGADVADQTHQEVPDVAFSLRQKPKIRIHLSSGPLIHGANIRTTFVGDLFDDPMVLLRLDHRQRCLSFDMGEVGKVPTRIVHQTSDVFMSHAHLDHIGDLSWMLRRLVGITTPVRLWGPEDIIKRVHHAVLAYTWDRIGDRGPRFEIYEWDGGAQLKRAIVQAGVDEIQWLEPLDIKDGRLIKEPRLEVHAAVLDHGGTPVLAYRVEESKVYGVRGNIIRDRGWKAGPWLGRLKTLVASESLDTMVCVDHLNKEEETMMSARELGELLLIPRDGQKIVYATDFADSPANREAVIKLAHKAHIFICEAGFIMEDADQAKRTGHMTTHGCAEIAKAADVQVLVPYHHSVRYEHAPELVYQELLPIFERTYVPLPILETMTAQARMKSTPE